VGKWHGYDCWNGIYVVRKGILMPRGAEVDAKNEGGMQCRVVGEERTDTRREMETNVCTDRKHRKNNSIVRLNCNN
jgi:hypothetical protein